MKEIIREFLIESHENLNQLDQDLVTLEHDPSRHEVFDNIFRTMHTLKGSCSVLGFSRLESIAHAGESLLACLRKGQLRLTTDITSVLLATADAVRKMVHNIEQRQDEGAEDYAELIARLKRFQAATGVSEAAPQVPPQAPEDRPLYDRLAEVETLSNSVKRFVSGNAEEAPAPVEPATAEEESAHHAPESAVSDSTIRVDVELLDKLVTLVGEMVLSRNQILQFAASNQDSAFQATVQRLNLVTSELQEAAMKTRMQPIGNIWSRFPRAVRDLSVACEKKVRLELDGRGTELDKSILEAIRAPLMHVIRNAVDHGIELPEARLAAGKPPEGVLSVRAFHEGGNVNIEICDDGAGIDPARIKRRALEQHLISEQEAERMSAAELTNLIFLPGFSTAEKVTNVSGRGVGMDVVKSNIEKIGGAIEVSSQLGRGTRLRIKIPLTLAIIPALMVSACGEFFAIPQANLLELVRVDKAAGERIEVIQDVEVYRLRGKLLPLLRLGRLLDLAPAGSNPSESEAERARGDGINIVVLQSGGRPFGLVVDEVLDGQEIVVKPLGRQLKGVQVFAGATIMGDGRVALILDVAGLAKDGVISTPADEQGDVMHVEHADDDAMERQTLLVFSISGEDRYAVPLAVVARLEEFNPNIIERAAGREVVQYRDSLLPLIRLDRALGLPPPQSSLTMPVIVFAQGDRSIGLVVGRILDVTSERMVIHQSAMGAAGIGGSVVINGKSTDLLDVYHIIEQACPGWFKSISVGKRDHRRILFVEDSTFFRGLLKPCLELNGYEVVEAADGQEAIDRLADHAVDLVLSDIDMPRMNGYQMAKKIRSMPGFSELPMIALTSLESEADRARGREAGFSDYQAKFDREAILEAIHRCLAKVHASNEKEGLVHA
ncbi:MAG TPA: chemotaxis protein CheW [Nitrospiria bacterium]|nr:chemotaxis protein CheW [Nitrospiria bacterium]